MADAITIKALQDASLDAKSLEDVVNGDETKQVTTRKGETYPSVKKAIKILFENGGIADKFKTLADLQASLLVDGDYALVADDSSDKNGIYIKEDGVWVKSKYDIAATQKNIANDVARKEVSKYLEVNSDEPLDMFVDREGRAYRYTDKSGHVYLPDLSMSDKSLQDNVNKSTDYVDSLYSDSSHLAEFTDSIGSMFACFDGKSNLHLSGDILLKGKSLSDAVLKVSSVSDTSKIRHEMMLLETQKEPMKKELIVDDYAEDNLIKRMPFGIKTEYGLLAFYHHQIAGYDGDATGSELWKAVIDVDNDYNPTVRSKELFKRTVADKGIVKHPMLGRLSDGRILLCFEMTEDISRITYAHYQCISDDEGLTFSEPQLMQFTNTRPAAYIALGTSGTILRLVSGRLVLPMGVFGGSPFTSYSDDDGQTWRYGQLIMPMQQGYEPSITFSLVDGLVMDTRPPDDSRLRKRFRSYDEGETWQRDVEATEVVSSTNQGVLILDPSTGIMLQTHTVHPDARRDFRLSLSYDDAKNFPYYYQVNPKDTYTGYSQILKFDEGIYAIFAEYAAQVGGANQQSAMLVILNLKEIISNVNYY